jgi:hypothetical protein
MHTFQCIKFRKTSMQSYIKSYKFISKKLNLIIKN